MTRVAVLLLLLTITAACGRDGTADAPAAQPAPPGAGVDAPPPLPDDVAQLGAGASPSASPEHVATDRLLVTGEFVAPVQSDVSPRVGGRVARVVVDEGARVSRGQLLLELETEYLQLDLQRADAELARATAQLTEAERDFKRKQDLIAKGSIPQASFDRSQGAYEQARAARAAAETGVALARQRLSDSKLVAPIEGIVLERRADVGERLGEQSVAFVIAQTSPLRLRFKLPERLLGSVRRGDRVIASVDARPDDPIEGRITQVIAAVDPTTRSFAAEAEFPNRDGRLTPGQFARVELDRPVAR